MEKVINESGKWRFIGVDEQSPLSNDMFWEVPNFMDDIQVALHTNIGSITVLDRMTGYGWRDIETGFRDMHNNFWLASGGYDVRVQGFKTIGEAIDWIKTYANTCNPTVLKVNDITCK